MAQGFYNAQEACAKLKKTEEELRKLVREGQLREFRDARGVMYRAQEIDALAGPGGDSVADLTLADSAAPATPAKPAAPSAAPAAQGDTSVFNLESAPSSEADAAKTDVFSLEPGGESGEEKKSGSGSGSSISLLDDLENITIPADPMAETVVSAGTEFEGAGAAGGSGLLDLARESDDTSLGAELYDESAEGEAKPSEASGSSLTPASSSVVAAEVRPAAAPMDYYPAAAMVEAADPMAPAFVAMSIVGLIALLIAGMAVAAGVIGSWPGLLEILYSYLLFYLLGALVAAGAAWGIGYMLGRQAEARRYAYSRAKAAPESEEA